MWMTLIFDATAGLFLAMTIAMLQQLRWVRRLPGLDRFGTIAGPHVTCSVVIAARDEDRRIESTVRHLLAQCGVGLEIIVVDDRSTDRTGDILRRLAGEDPRVRLTRVDVLPEGWLGKCHACHVGANAATGDWILFTDADCWLKPDVIARALAVADSENADHVTMAAGTVLERSATRGWYLLFLSALGGWFAKVNQDRPKSHVGIGAFNLVRAAAYRECGGYEALRLTVVDDIKLGLLLSRAGKRTRAFLGADDLQCHWGTTVGSMVKIMEKNYFAALDYRLGPGAGGEFGGGCGLRHSRRGSDLWNTCRARGRAVPAIDDPASGDPGASGGLVVAMRALDAVHVSRFLLDTPQLDVRHSAPGRNPLARDLLSSGHLARRECEMIQEAPAPGFKKEPLSQGVGL